MTPFISRKSRSLRGDLKVAGDKSISHRALMLSSQALGETTIFGLLEGEDVMRTAAALRLMGVSIERIIEEKDAQTTIIKWLVKGVGIGGLQESPEIMDMGNSGTSTRLLMGLVTPYPYSSFFTGDSSLCSRPMKRVITPLEQIGAQIVAHSGATLPLSLKGTANPNAIHYTLPVASAQVKSAILLAALNTSGITTVIEKEATRDHTENMLEFFSIPLERKKTAEGIEITISGKPSQEEKQREIYVPGDPSSAAFPVVAALIVPDSELLIRNVCINDLRSGLFTTLREMGANIVYENERLLGGEKIADLRVKSSALLAVDVPAQRAPSMIDEYPILAVAAAFAEGESVMRGLGELRVKESDRLSSVIENLRACGVEARAEGDNLHVRGKSQALRGATKAKITTRFDHRIAMAFMVLGMASNEAVEIDDADAIKTSFPEFIELMNSLGAAIIPARADKNKNGGLNNGGSNNVVNNVQITNKKPLVIAIDGPAASGKGTLARRLAENFGMDYLDTGSLYRAVGMKMIYGGKDPENKEAAIETARSIDIDDLSNPRLRQEKVGKAASIISAFPEVRAVLLDYQRNFAASAKGAVLDGRDIGTVVCPEADYKFFITATLYARAKRRHKELEGQGIEVVFESVLEDLRERDERDQNRKSAPLRPADDAIIIEASAAAAEEIYQRALRMIER